MRRRRVERDHPACCTGAGLRARSLLGSAESLTCRARRRWRGRLTRSTSACLSSINNGVYRAGLARRRKRPTRVAFSQLFDSFRLARGACWAVRRYLAGISHHGGRLASVPDARSLRRGIQPALPPVTAGAWSITRTCGPTRASSTASTTRDVAYTVAMYAVEVPLLHDPRRAQPEAHHPCSARATTKRIRTVAGARG